LLRPSPITLFLSRRFSSVSSATTSFSALASRRRSFTSEVAARAVSPASRFAGLKEGFRPAVIQILDDPLTAAELGDALFAAQALQHNADLVLRRKMSSRRAADVPNGMLDGEITSWQERIILPDEEIDPGVMKEPPADMDQGPDFDVTVSRRS
jgi:hypothetical protein